METFLLEHGGALRLGVFFGALVLLSGLEWAFPRRVRTRERGSRWPMHLFLGLLGAAAGRLLAPLGAIAAAQWAAAHQFGALHAVALPPWIEACLGIVLLDLAVFGQHVASHRWAWAWRLHRLHHRDEDLDATSGVRFHPVEIALSVLWKASVVLLLGPSVAVVIAFEILLNAAAICTHANLRLPLALDRTLRVVLVTPDMHRIHHSLEADESSTNFGTITPLWDRLFGTYLRSPRKEQRTLPLGVAEDTP